MATPFGGGQSQVTGRSRTTRPEPSARERGDFMRMAQEWLIEEVTNTSLDPKKQSNPFGRAAQNLGSGLTMGLIPRKPVDGPEARTTRAEIAAHPEWAETFGQRNKTERRLALVARKWNRPGLCVRRGPPRETGLPLVPRVAFGVVPAPGANGPRVRPRGRGDPANAG